MAIHELVLQQGHVKYVKKLHNTTHAHTHACTHMHTHTERELERAQFCKFSCTKMHYLYYRHKTPVTCPHQMRHCSWSLCPDGLDYANHINLSLCLHLLNQRPNGYECTSATETIAANEERIGIHVQDENC